MHAYEHPIVRMTMRGSDVLEAWRRRGSLELYESGLESVHPDGTYSVALNAVLAAAPRFNTFDRGTKAERIGTDLEALVDWLGRDSEAEAR